MSSICKICGIEVSDLKKHLSEDHLMGTWGYREINYGYPQLSPNWPGMYLAPLPEWGPKKYLAYVLSELSWLRREVTESKYLQAILANRKLLEYIPDRNIWSAAGLVKSLAGPKRLRENTYLGLYLRPGYPKEVSERNREGLGVVSVSIPVGRGLKVTISGNTYIIVLPETCGYDSRHHSRYSILNPGSSRYTKRIKLSDNTCYKFWNTDGPFKTILRIQDTTGKTLETSDIPETDLFFIKQVCLRDRRISGVLWSIYQEIATYTHTLTDKVLLGNKILVNESKKLSTILTWFPEPNITTDTPGTSYISIL